MPGRSDSDGKLVEGRAELVAGGEVSDDLVVAAAQIPDEHMRGGHDPRGPEARQAAHRPPPGLQPSVTGFGPAVRVAPGRSGQVAPFGHQDANDLAVLTDDPVPAGPPASHLHLRLAGEPAATATATAPPGGLDELG